MTRHRIWKFRLLLTALLLLIVTQPLLGDHRLVRVCYTLAWSFVQIVTIYAISEIRWQRIVGWALGGPALLGIWIRYLVSGPSGEPIEIAVFGTGAAFFGLAAVMVMRHLVTSEVTADNVSGAVCAYLFLGLGIGLLYSVIETFHAHSFHATGELAAELANPVHRRTALSYFSFVTLTTAGYGDITPATSLTRVLAALEAVLGQFYLAVLVAGLVGIRVSRSANGSRNSA